MSTAAEAAAATLLEKMVTENVPVQFNFEPLFDDGVNVTLTLKITEILTGADVTGTMSLGNFGLKVGTQRTYSHLVKSGTAGKSYYVAAHAVGDDTSEQDLVWILPVVDLRLG